MTDHERPTQRPQPPRPRARLSSNHDSDGLSSNERELILQAIQTATAQATKQVKADLEARIAQSQRAPAPKKHDWGDIATKFVAALALIGTTLGALKPTKDERVDKAYEDLAKAVKTIETQQQRTDSSVESLRSWLAGYLNATGVKTIDPPGAPPAQQVELLPAPLVRGTKRGQAEAAPAIQVRTPLPAPPPSVAPIKLAPKLAP